MDVSIWHPHEDSNPEAKQFRRLPPVHRAEGIEGVLVVGPDFIKPYGIEVHTSDWKGEAYVFMLYPRFCNRQSFVYWPLPVVTGASGSPQTVCVAGYSTQYKR